MTATSTSNPTLTTHYNRVAPGNPKRETLLAALKLLGREPTAVVAALHRRGIRGVPYEPSNCPIAEFLRVMFPGADVVVARGCVFVGSAEAEMPDGVANFVSDFDGGSPYTALVRRDVP